MEKYEKETLLGHGSFGKVWLVRSTLSRVCFAMKEVDLTAMSHTDRLRALKEVTFLSKCKHRNIVKYHNAIEDSTGKLLILMEYADGGDLYTAILKQNGVPFTDNCVISWFLQMSLALQYIHYQNILHRDLKTQNIFLTKGKIIKLGDFGVARVLRNSEDLASTCIGTPYYLSPEICQRKPYNNKSDMWALGCILFEISSLERPFEACDFIQLMHLILQGIRKELPSRCNFLIREFVDKLLANDPAKRPSADEILATDSLQPYLQKYVLTHACLIDTSVSLGNNFERSPVSHLSPKPQTGEITALGGKFVSLKTSTPNILAFPHKTPPVAMLKAGNSRFNSQRDQSPKVKRFVNSTNERRIIDTTYIISDTIATDAKPNRSEMEAQTDVKCAPIDSDCGYQSSEADLGSSDEKPGSTRNDKLTESRQSSMIDNQSAKYVICSKVMSTQRRRNSCQVGHDLCQHSQCPQCILDMLWKNRIRGSDGAVNTSEYTKLKNKLHRTFKNELFENVYHSLRRDYERSEIDESRTSIQTLMETLNYEQVQNLPLMMQLIQLDLLV